MKRYAKQTALALAMALTVSSVAPATASAATRPSYKKKFNAVKKGKTLTYTVKNIKKGTKVKWSIIGTGKKYVSFNKSKAVYKENTKAAKKKTYSSNKVYVRKNTTKVVKAVVKATVTGKNGKKYTVSDKIAIAKKATTPATTTPASAEPTATAAVTTAPATTAPASAEPTTAPATTAPASVAPSATAAVTSGPATTAPVATTTAPETSAPAATTTPTVAPTETTAPSATPEVATAAAVSAGALNTKTIAVTFNRALTADEQADVIKAGNITVVKDKVTQNIKTKFNDAKTLYVTTSADSSFVEGTYTVTLNGTIKYTADVKVEAQKAESLKIVSTVVENATTAAIKVTLADQYNAEMTLKKSELQITCINKTDASRKATATVTADGKVEINASACKVDDEIIVTAVYATSAKTLTDTATLKVVKEDYVNKLVLGDIVLPSTATRLTLDTKDVKVEYTATKFYGDSTEIKLGNTADYTVISSNPDVIAEAAVGTTVDSVTKKNYITISGFAGVGTATLVFVNNKTGETVSTTITVLQNAGVATSATLAQDKVTVAKGSKAYVAITVKDNYGDVIAAEKLADQVNVISSNASNIPNGKLITDKTDANYGKIEIDATNATEKSTVVCTITVANTPLVLTVSVAEQAKPSSLTAVASTEKLLVGGKTEVAVSAIDQYSGKFTVKGSDYTLKATSDSKDGEKVVVAEVDEKQEKVTVTAKKAGTDVVTISLVDKTGTAILNQKITFTVVANDAQNFDYAVKDIPVLCPNTVTSGSAVKFDDVKNYAQKIEVTATQKADSSVVMDLPAGNVIDVKSDSDVVGVEQKDGIFYVYGKATKALTADVTANLTVTILTDAGYQTVKKVVTVSKDDAKAQSVVLYDKAITDDKKAPITAITVTSAAVAASGVAVNLATIDQYSVASEVDGSKVKVDITALNKITASGTAVTAKVVDGKLYIDGIKTNEKDATLQVNVLVDGVYTAFTVKIQEEQK